MSQHATERQLQRNVSEADITDALQKPLKTSEVQYRDGQPSVKIIGAKATVIINPETSKIITVYRTHTKVVIKLMNTR